MMISRLSAAATAAAFLLLAGTLTVAPLSAQEQEAAKTLIPGRGSGLTQMRCVVCHEITHITRSKLSRAEWQDTMQLMVQRGAQLSPQDIAVITDYLVAYYGRDAAPPPDPSAADFGMGGGAVTAGGGAADPVAQLLDKHACTACHQVDKRVVGPSFKEIASRFSANSDAASVLLKKVKEGSSGSWGQVPMPPQTAVSDADLGQMLGWILNRK